MVLGVSGAATDQGPDEKNRSGDPQDQENVYYWPRDRGAHRLQPALRLTWHQGRRGHQAVGGPEQHADPGDQASREDRGRVELAAEEGETSSTEQPHRLGADASPQGGKNHQGNHHARAIDREHEARLRDASLRDSQGEDRTQNWAGAEACHAAGRTEEESSKEPPCGMRLVLQPLSPGESLREVEPHPRHLGQTQQNQDDRGAHDQSLAVIDEECAQRAQPQSQWHQSENQPQVEG